MTYVHKVISRGVDIPEFPSSHFLQQVSTQRGLLFRGLVSYELTAFISIFSLFF